VDLGEADLSRALLRGCDLRVANLQGADCTGTHFRQCVLD
jgi:uncharacterized protein YjbI with pentapeptide repeats